MRFGSLPAICRGVKQESVKKWMKFSQFRGKVTVPDRQVVLYTRQGCHLCDDARAILVRYGLSPREVDIDAVADLRTQFNECVPVVEIDGQIRFRGRVDERLLQRLLHAR